MRQRLLERGRLGTLVQERLLQRIERPHGHAGGVGQAEVAACRAEHAYLVLAVLRLPEGHGPVLEREGLVHGGRAVDGECLAHALACGAGALARVERELRARDLVHALAARGAELVHAEVVAHALRLLHAVGRAEHLAAVRAGVLAQLLEHHAQRRVHVGRRAHGGARVAVRAVLQNGDGGGGSPHALHRGLGDALHREGLQVQALALGCQHVHEQGGLARPRHAREHGDLVLGDGERDVAQVALARADDGEGAHKGNLSPRGNRGSPTPCRSWGTGRKGSTRRTSGCARCTSRGRTAPTGG